MWYQVFTLDPGFSAAVAEAFCTLHERGLIHRRDRLVNWSSALGSAISDIEVEKVVLDGPKDLVVPGVSETVPFGRLWSVAYPVVDHNKPESSSCVDSSTTDEFVVVATTRPETIFGDVAVAVHPDDQRYKDVQGKRLRNPLTGKVIPIVLDPTLVDPQRGTVGNSKFLSV